MSETKSTPSLESTLKSLDTEEFIDIHFYRPIGYQWALFFNKLWRVGELATRFTFQEQQVNIAIIIRHGCLLAMEESRRIWDLMRENI